MATHLRHPPSLVEALRSFMLDPWLLFQSPFPPSLVRMACEILLLCWNDPDPVSYAADAHISNNPNVLKMARSSNAQSPELWEREYSWNLPNEMEQKIAFALLNIVVVEGTKSSRILEFAFQRRKLERHRKKQFTVNKFSRDLGLLQNIRHCWLRHFAHLYWILGFVSNPPQPLPSSNGQRCSYYLGTTRPGELCGRRTHFEQPELWERNIPRNSPTQGASEMSMCVKFAKNVGLGPYQTEESPVYGGFGIIYKSGK
ncbi:hypothetical protein CEXT_292711 [Caerostris extrusa]|uniref:Uncharacterized protein n=1 Tax=Caerostris extrusa TaxID=172846 RepID=A0AAV4W7E6_CAEEX|nr:hypothetical protein CEXT_292711 [Caerostris extrusa]